MKKHKIICIFLLCLMLIFPFIFNGDYLYAQEQTPLKFRAYGDSIAAGYKPAADPTPENPNPKPTKVDKSYPEVFAEKYIQHFGGEINNCAVSGDTTQDLVNILTPYKNETAVDFEDFMSTNYFSLCIGANNILGPALSSLSKIIDGTMTNDQFKVLLDEGVNKFKTDYNQQIIPTLTKNKNAKVYIMTIYHPYKHFQNLTLNDIQIDEQAIGVDKSILSVILSPIIEKFKLSLRTAMEYLEQINNEIRLSAKNNKQIVLVDIQKHFEEIPDKDYPKYINADIQKLVINTTDTQKLKGIIAKCADPHPTQLGHNEIGRMSARKLVFVDFNCNKDLNSLSETDSEITVSLNLFSGEINHKYIYNLIKNSNGKNEVLDSNNSGTFSISRKTLEGQGNIFIEIYDNDEKIATSKSLSYNVSKIDKTNNKLTVSLIVILSTILISVIIAVVIIFTIKKTKIKNI